MRKSTYLLILWATLVAQNHAQAQWAAQNSSTTVLLNSVFFTDPNTGYVVGYNATTFNGLLLKTTNGGSTWAPLNLSSSALSSVYFMDANTGYIAGNDTIFKTTNAGASWAKYPVNLGAFMFAVKFYNSTIGYATGMNFSSSTAAMLKTTNAGSTWGPQTIPSPLHFHPNSLFCTSADICYLSGGYALKTTDGGTTWNGMTTQSTADWSSAYFTSATNGVIVGGGTSSGSIDRSTNAGATWNTVYSSSQFLSSAFFVDASTGYVVGAGGVILKTTNSGVNWLLQTSPVVRKLNSVHFPAANIGYAVGDSGTIIKYTAPSSVSDPALLPAMFELEQNYPNPWNPATRIRYGLPHTSYVTLTVYNTLGQQVAQLVNEQQQAGYHDVVFRGDGLASGVYFYRLDAGSFTNVKKLLLLK